MASAGPFPSILAPAGIESTLLAMCSDDARLQRLLNFESALIRALAYCERVSPDHARTILSACDLPGEDRAALLAAMSTSASTSAPRLAPFLDKLRLRAAAIQHDAAAFVHFGANDDDAIDCAMKLEMRALSAIIRQSLHEMVEAMSALAETRREIPSSYPPDTIDHLSLPDGLHLAEKAALLARITRHFEQATADALALCFGSSPEALIRLNHDCEAIAERLTVELGLPLADHTPNHQRQTNLAFGFCLVAIVSACGSIAYDLGQRYPALEQAARAGDENRSDGGALIASISQTMPELISRIYGHATHQPDSRGAADHLMTQWSLASALALHAIGALEALRTLCRAIDTPGSNNVRQMRLNIWEGAQHYIDTQFDQIDLD